MSKNDNLIRRTHVFHDYYARLKNIAMSVFKWDGLPKSCNARFLEDCLFHYGQAIFIDDPTMGYLNLKCTPASELNPYNEPKSFTAFSIGYNKIFGREDCVYIRNNYLAKSTESTLLLFAERLTKIEMSLGININAQKTPLLIKTDDKTRKTMETIYQQYDGDKPVIITAKAMTDKPIEVLKTDAPFVADRLRDEKRAVWNEALEFLGINTNPSDKKKERLITNEVDANNEQIDIQVLTMLLCRQQACEEINEKYKLNVNVSLRVDDLKPKYEDDGEGDDDGKLYS